MTKPMLSRRRNGSLTRWVAWPKGLAAACQWYGAACQWCGYVAAPPVAKQHGQSSAQHADTIKCQPAFLLCFCRQLEGATEEACLPTSSSRALECH